MIFQSKVTRFPSFKCHSYFLGNVLWDNGQVSKDAPESRQPYAGLTLNGAINVAVSDNFVKTEFKDDFAYAISSETTLDSSNSQNNKVSR